MKIKKKTVLAVITALGISASITYAYCVPGVDEPYDPPNYYSPTSISYPDSAPSIFAMRELSRGDVYDYTRHVKSILFGNDFKNWNSSILSQVLNHILDMTGFDKNVLAEAQQKVNDILNNTHGIGIGHDIQAATGQTLLRTTLSSTQSAYDENAQATWASTIYYNSLQSFSNSDSDMQGRINALNAVMENSAGSEGNIEASQSDVQASALYNSEMSRRNALIANYSAVEAAHNRLKVNQEIKDIEQNKKALAFKVYNPNNPETQDSQNYTKPDAPGFYDF